MADIDSPKFGAEIKERLFQLNMTQSELAERIGISPAYLADILAGKRFGKRKRMEIAGLLYNTEGKAVFERRK